MSVFNLILQMEYVFVHLFLVSVLDSYNPFLNSLDSHFFAFVFSFLHFNFVFVAFFEKNRKIIISGIFFKFGQTVEGIEHRANYFIIFDLQVNLRQLTEIKLVFLKNAEQLGLDIAIPFLVLLLQQ